VVVAVAVPLTSQEHGLAQRSQPMNRRQRRAEARLRQIPSNPRVEDYLRTGLNHEHAGRLTEAEAAFRQALALQPNHSDALHLLGVVALKAGQLSAAVELIRLALKHNGQNAVYLSNLGAALSYQRAFGEAIAAYRQAIRIKPDFAEAHSGLGNALREAGQLDEAAAACRQAVRVRPDYAEAHSNLGVTLHNLGKLDEAVAAFRKAIAIKSGLAETHSNLGIVLRDQGKLDEAIAAFREAIRINPNLAGAYSNLGSALRDQNKLGEAVAACSEAIRIRPGFADAYANLGAALRDQGNLKEAVAACRQAIALDPNIAEAHNNLGVTLIELGQVSQGHTEFEHAIRLAPRIARYRRNLLETVRCVAGDPQVTELERLANERERLSVADQIELQFALGKAYEDIGRHAEAFRQWLDGNALKRRQITYDEAKTLGSLDHIRDAFTPELIRQRQNIGQSSAVPVFIFGMLRSGTTLVEQILASHPQVSGGGELAHFQAAIARIQTTSGKSAHSTDLSELLPDMNDEDFRALGARYLQQVEKLGPAPHITDKMPSNFMFAGFIHLALPNARMIHTIRDPIDTCLSCFSKLFTGKQNHTYDLAELGRYYRRYRTLMMHWRDVLPAGRILDVRYEDVVADLEGQARRIVAHCGLDWDPRCLAFHETQRPVATASAMQVRRPIYTSAIGRWRRHQAFLGPLLAELTSG
jgi:tetratricopeptide (TPR) repeat protein